MIQKSKAIILISFLLVLSIFIVSDCFAYVVAARERTRIVYGKGFVDEQEDELEIYYEVDEARSLICRQVIKKVETGEVTEDDTTFTIVKNEVDKELGSKVINAVTNAPFDPVELLVIGETFVLSCKSVADHLEASEMQRIQVESPVI